MLYSILLYQKNDLLPKMSTAEKLEVDGNKFLNINNNNNKLIYRLR